MRIAILTHGYPNEKTHSSTFVHARAKAYQRAGHAVTVLVPDDESRSAVGEFDGVKVIRDSPRQPFTAAFSEADVIFLHTPIAGTTLAACPESPPCPVVTYVHGAEVGVGSGSPPFLWWQKQKRALRKHFARGWPVVVASKYMEGEVRRIWGVKNVHIVSNPVDLDFFKPDGRERNGRGLCRRGKGTKYGTDMLDDPQVTIMHPEDSIIPYSELPSLLNRYSFFVAPSRVEPQGVMMMEALACGLPVVATNVGGIPEYIVDGYNGFLCLPNKPSIDGALRRYREAVGAGMYGKMSTAARESAKAFDSRVIVKQDLELVK